MSHRERAEPMNPQPRFIAMSDHLPECDAIDGISEEGRNTG